MAHNEIVFSFASTQHAIQAEQCLLSALFPVSVIPLPASIKAGCGIALRLPLEMYEQAYALLQSSNIFPLTLHIRSVDGGGLSAYTQMEGK